MEAIKNVMNTVQSFSQTALPTLKQIAPQIIFGASTATTALALGTRTFCRRKSAKQPPAFEIREDGVAVPLKNESKTAKAAKVATVVTTLSAVVMAASGALLLGKAGFNKTGLGDGSIKPSIPLTTPTSTLTPPKVPSPHRGPWHRRY